MPNWGGAASGAVSGAALGSFIPGIGTGIGAGVGGLIGLFTGKKKKPEDNPDDALSSIMASLKDSSAQKGQQGAVLSGAGMDQLAPVLDYFKKITGNDPSAVLDATKASRGRVIDQYDTARQAISEFGPRGGGTNSALAASRFSEADQLSNVTESAKQNAIAESAQLGTTLTGLGLSAEQLKSADLNTIVNAILAKKGLDVQASGQNKAMAGQLSEGLGTLLGLYLTRGSSGGSSGSDFVRDAVSGVASHG